MFLDSEKATSPACKSNILTWDGVDYELLVNLVHNKIGSHALHQQLCKTHVQMVALIASTNVNESYRLNLPNVRSYIMCPLNRIAVF
jgi:hypothetical protein